jgi:hypothetical protein
MGSFRDALNVANPFYTIILFEGRLNTDVPILIEISSQLTYLFTNYLTIMIFDAFYDQPERKNHLDGRQ